jgi:DNA-binding response OmpR family regulator
MRVLVVEDEALVAMLLKDMLADMGHDVVITAGRLQDALDAANEAEVDFAVVDLNLRGEHTYEVGHALKARGVPFFFATGYGAGGLPTEWSKQTTLQKPFQPVQLEAAVDECLAALPK